MVNLNLSNDEAHALRQFIDLGLKSAGLGAAQMAAALAYKLDMAQQDQGKTEAKERGEKAVSEFMDGLPDDLREQVKAAREDAE